MVIKNFKEVKVKMFDLSPYHAVVTGATGGIGRAIATSLHHLGATVILSGTREDALGDLAKELGDRTHVMPCNLSDKDAVEGLIPQAQALVGHVDILVNNAGITKDTLVMRMKDEDWQRVIDVNLTSTFRLCRAAIMGMMKQKYGRIINIASVVGVTGNPGQANYCASKAGMIGMSKGLAREVASRGITVNCVAPGFIQTNMTDVLTDQVKQTIMGTIPAGRMGTAEEIASAVVYLASKEAAYVTGTTLHVNGGMAMI